MTRPYALDCPGPDCLMCSGAACNLCGAGCWNNSAPYCDHASDERHEDPAPVATNDSRSGLPGAAAVDAARSIDGLIDEFNGSRDSMAQGRAELRRERREDGVLPWDAGGES